jgi:DNA-directed RNA polymerase subunit RPC12/RpoP
MSENQKLQPCPDCGHKISKKAAACPSCGRRISFAQSSKEQIEEDEFRLSKEQMEEYEFRQGLKTPPIKKADVKTDVKRGINAALVSLPLAVLAYLLTGSVAVSLVGLVLVFFGTVLRVLRDEP